jgi:hypothetical protein
MAMRSLKPGSGSSKCLLRLAALRQVSLADVCWFVSDRKIVMEIDIQKPEPLGGAMSKIVWHATGPS